MKSIRSKVRVIAMIGALAVALPAVSAGTATRVVADSGGFTREISSGGTTSFQPTTSGSDQVQWPEYPGQADNGGGPAPYRGTIVDRSQSKGSGNGALASSAGKAKSNPELVLSFDGLNHRNQRLANGGNQFSLEPPDQGLCAGNGFVIESINDILRVYDTSGHALIGVTDLNTFYGYPAAIHRAPPRVFGQFVTDPSCYYDAQTQRWFNVVLTLEVNPQNGHFLGPNHLDIAVSQTSNPTGSWNIYRLPVQDDGTQGTPDHGCSLSADKTGQPVGHGPCLGDYPHIGADANGFYVTTNEYSFFGPEFKAAQLYAFSKQALASGAASVAVTQFNTVGTVGSEPGFTIWPATTPGDQFAGNTEFFMSSDGTQEAQCPLGNCTPQASTNLIVWSLTNTGSLNSTSPSVSLSNTVLQVNPYAIPPRADQKAGDFPLGQCLNNTACATFLNGVPDPFAPNAETNIDSNDTRMQQVVYANGKLWGALDTALTLNGVNKAGIEWFIVNPQAGKVDNQGYLGLANNNLTYPAVGVTQSGRGVMAFTLVGADYYPSAAYAGLDDKTGAGPIHVAAAGAGPDDGFSAYKFYNAPFPPRPRWGDYGAAVPDGNTMWIASEYIGQTCTLAQYESAPFGSCGGTRTSLANWDTRISKLNL